LGWLVRSAVRSAHERHEPFAGDQGPINPPPASFTTGQVLHMNGGRTIV
jgi:hypothetical protein